MALAFAPRGKHPPAVNFIKVKRREFAQLVVGPAFVAASATRVSAQSPAPVSVTFGAVGVSAFNWSVLTAQPFWTAGGLKVDVIFTGSVAADIQQLTVGAIDVGEIASTQLIQAIVGGAPIVAIAQHLATAPDLVLGRKGLTSIAQLKGKTIVVGGVNDISRVFMDRILTAARLAPDDYTYVYAGSTSARLAALLSGGVDAAVLSPPASTRAADQGYPVLAEVAKYFPSFFFDTLAARPAWTSAHPDVALAFAKGYLQGVRWLYDPANKTRAIQALSDSIHVSVADAAESYDLLVTKRAFSTTGIMTDRDVAVVLDAMVKAGQLTPPLPPPSRFYDNTYIEEANAQLGNRPR